LKTEKAKAIGRVSLVFVLSVVIWRLTLLLFDGQKFASNVLCHIAAGLFLSVLICMLIIATLHAERKINDFSWKRAVPGYLKNLSFGFLCWIIPATISMYFLTLTGQVAIALQTESTALVMRFLVLLVAVFFIEAFPEEIVRGYLYSRLESSFSPWVALLAQTALFTLFAFLIGSLYSTDQWLFIPGFGFLLGYFRMLSGDIWFSMGFHAAMMTITQLISPMRQLVEVDGNFFVVRFLSFILIPAIVSSIILHFKKSHTKA
jgi:membrane protease YdiL (CAAX protease family)